MIFEIPPELVFKILGYLDDITLRRLKKIGDDLDDMDDMESKIDKMIERGSVKVEHGLLLRNQFERVRDKLTGKGQLERIRNTPSVMQDYSNSQIPNQPPQRSSSGPPPGRSRRDSSSLRGGPSRPKSPGRTPSSRSRGPPSSYGDDY